MATTSIAATAASGPAAAPPPSAQLSKGTGEDYDRFLKLLTAQMKHQDPMQPTDPTQFVAQLAHSSQVEHHTKSNTYLKAITEALTGNSSLAENAALLGRTVRTQLSEITLNAPGATVPLTLEVNAGALRGTRLEVVDSAGQVVRKVALNSGGTTLAFDGKDTNGAALPAGKYAVRVVGEDGFNARQSAGTVSSAGKVTEVRRNNGELSLLLENGAVVKAGDVTRLGAA